MAKTILIVDDSMILRDLMSAALRAAGYETLQAANASAALLAIHSFRIDLMVLDIGMPQVDGLTMLAQLRGRKGGIALPVILLTSHEELETIRRAAALGVRDYVLKSKFSLRELLIRVQQRIDPIPPIPANVTNGSSTTTPPKILNKTTVRPSLAAPPIDPARFILLTRDQTRDRLVEVTGTRTCAGVVAQVMALVNSPDSDIAELVRVIESDPIIASRVLQLANSAMFRQKFSGLSSVEEAIRKVGMRAIHNIVVSIGIFQAFPPDSNDGFNTMRCWQHSVAVSAILRVLMRDHNEEAREHLALVGLCHDLGEIVLRQHFAGEYEQILSHARQSGQAVSQIEAVALSMRHGELVNEVLTRIGLPPNISIPIMRFHERDGAGAGPSLQIVRMLQLANAIAHGMMLVPSSDALLAPITRSDLKRACGQEAVTLDTEALRREVLISTNILARLPAADELRFIAPLYPRRSLSIWYIRHASYAIPDPLETALRLMAQVRCEARLPQGPEELAGTDLIVVASPFADSPPASKKDILVMQNEAGYHQQPIILMLGNSAGAGLIPHTTACALPISLHALAEMIEKTALVPSAAA